MRAELTAVQAALRVAYRHIDAEDTSEAEKESILAAVTDEFSGAIGETAAQSLHHLREQRRTQLTLAAVLDGIGPVQPDSGKQN